MLAAGVCKLSKAPAVFFFYYIIFPKSKKLCVPKRKFAIKRKLSLVFTVHFVALIVKMRYNKRVFWAVIPCVDRPRSRIYYLFFIYGYLLF